MNWIKSKVVMLPTEKATIIYKFEETNKLIFSNHPNQHELATPQHLYFTSDEEIKEGDWCVNANNTIVQYRQLYRDKEILRKIISSTNKSSGLPKPSKEFIEVYVKAHNEGKKIEEVLIQCNEKGLSLHGRGGERTITIKKVKDSWSRAEVIEFAKLALQTNGSLSTSAGFEWIERNL